MRKHTKKSGDGKGFKCENNTEKNIYAHDKVTTCKQKTVMSCHVMAWHVVSCHGMPWHGMPCHVRSGDHVQAEDCSVIS